MMFRLGITVLILSCSVALAAAPESKLKFGRFGEVTIYRPAPQPHEVVLFISGDGGWNKGVVDMARELAGMDTLVVGIDIVHYLKQAAQAQDACTYAAADFEALSQYVQKKLGLTNYTPPLLVGYSSGATLVYALLVQAPVGTFRGSISLGFCPDLMLHKPMCKGRGLQFRPGSKAEGTVFSADETLQTPWIALNGNVDQVCALPAQQEFIGKVPGGSLVPLPKVGHGFSVQRNWLPQFKEAVQKLSKPATESSAHESGSVADLPLVEAPLDKSTGDTLAVIISGDGGWAGLDREMAAEINKADIPVVGFNSLQYFWTRRTPEDTARDVERVVRAYSTKWHKTRVLLIGYSRGADVLPFVLNRLPGDIKARVRLATLLAPAHSIEFEFHIGDWLGDGERSAALSTLPEARKIKGVPLLCIYGSEEKDTLCKDLEPPLANKVELSGAHNFGGDYAALAHKILTEAGLKSPQEN